MVINGIAVNTLDMPVCKCIFLLFRDMCIWIISANISTLYLIIL